MRILYMRILGGQQVEPLPSFQKRLSCRLRRSCPEWSKQLPNDYGCVNGWVVIDIVTLC